MRYTIKVNINGEEIQYERPLVFKWNDPVKGEQIKNWILVPKVTANISKKVMGHKEKYNQYQVDRM